MKKWVDAEVMELSLTETNCSNPWEWFIPKPIRPLRPVKPVKPIRPCQPPVVVTPPTPDQPPVVEEPPVDLKS